VTQDEEFDLTVAVLAPCGHKTQQAANDHVDDGEQHRRILRERHLRARTSVFDPLSRRFATRAEARSASFEWIDVFYNRQRRHSTLGQLSSAEFEGSYVRALTS
jgi:transposase InsO family protein